MEYPDFATRRLIILGCLAWSLVGFGLGMLNNWPAFALLAGLGGLWVGIDMAVSPE